MKKRLTALLVAGSMMLLAAPAVASPPGCSVSGKQYAQEHIRAGNLGIETDFNIGKIGIEHKPGAHQGLANFPFC